MRRKGHIWFWLSAFAGIVAMACEDEAAAPAGAGYSSEVILFTSPYTVSRSAQMRYGSFEERDEVGVLGYCKAEYRIEGQDEAVDASNAPWERKKEFAKPEVFYNEPLTYQGNGAWTYNWTETENINGLHPWYANTSYTYTFFAYYPYAADGTISNGDVENMGTITLSGRDAAGDPTITYTMPHTTGGELAWNVVPDLMLAYRVDHLKSDGAVSLNFRHMLCAFEFEINNYNTEPVTISSLRFNGTKFYKSLSVTGQEQNYTVGNDRYSGYFDLISSEVVCPKATVNNGEVITPSTVRLMADGTVAEDGELKDVLDLLFIPDEEGKITEGECSVQVKTGNGEGTTQALRDGMTFEPGVRSIFSINIIGNNFVIQVRTENNWSDGGDSEINFD